MTKSVFFSFLCFLLLLSACSTGDMPGEDITEIQTPYGHWEAEGFIENGEMHEYIKWNNTTNQLILNKDSTFEGSILNHRFSGKYEFNMSRYLLRFTLSDNLYSAYSTAGEGKSYLDLLSKVYQYKVVYPDQLRLYYDDENYLKYKAVPVNK